LPRHQRSRGGGAGIEGERSGLWSEYARVVCEIRPSHVFVENSPMLTSRGLGRVFGDLAAMGSDARWCVLGADDIGAPHRRKRIWILANSRHVPWRNRAISTTQKSAETSGRSQVGNALREGLEGAQNDGGSSRGIQQEPSERCEDVSNPASERQSGSRTHWYAFDPAEKRDRETDRAWTERVGRIWSLESPVGRVAHGVANRMDRLKAIGNGQVSSVARLAWETLLSRARVSA